MGRVLNAATVVRNPQTTAVVTLHSGDPVPEWAEDLVGDHLTADSHDAVGGEATGPAPEPAAAPDAAAGGDPEPPAPDPDPVPPAPEPNTAPPRAGRGSNVEAWQTYAQSLGVTVPDDASRDAIIELVDEHLVK